MKKGFTLFELLAVIAILGVVALITIPVVNDMIKKSKDKLYHIQIEEIKDGAEKWAYENIDLLPNNEGENVTLTLLELKKAGYVSLDIRNPKTNELLPNDMQIKITLKSNNYVYEVLGETGTNVNNDIHENSPILILSGNAIEYVEVGTSYEEKGAVAKDKNGNIIESTVIYEDNGVEIVSIPTNKYKTYTAIYSANSTVNGNIYTSRITRTIIVRDTIAPELIVPSNITIYLEDIESFDILDGVFVTDNSGETLNVEVTNYDESIGEKIVSYKVCDSHNNCTTKKRIVVIK